MKNLVLVGFMGSGKSSVARRVAPQLEFEMIDSDSLIERRAGLSISQIFETRGEEHFRRLEEQIMTELADRNRLVIATGGGAVLSAVNWANWRRSAVVIALDVDSETAFERTRHHQHRPLLQGEDPLAKIQHLLAQREDFYSRADARVDTVGRTVEQVARDVLDLYERRVAD
ncbi:MAG: shikimate kinase [Verrucomicrobiae bacterium]|nr:shikimate kinase [Verrucomicrobiae bacterium]